MNIHQLTGTVDGDVQSFSVGDKTKYAFRLAEEGGKGWHNIVIWEGDAPVPRKGDFIYLEGRIATRSYEVDGAKRYTTEHVARVMRPIGAAPAAPAATEFDD